MQLTGILREKAFSPHQHGENDRLILEHTARVLTRKGCSVRLISETDVGNEEIDTPVVFSMCQGPRANRLLLRDERRGALIINSPQAVQRCYRVNLHRFLNGSRKARLMPPTVIVETSAKPVLPFNFGAGSAFWVKRGDVHATQSGDVVKVSSQREYADTITDFRSRGVELAAVQQHIPGLVVKFYGVVDTSFFRFYSEDDYKVAPVMLHRARPAIEQLVRKMGLDVYGGDAVITLDGDVFVIDINDWPSFAYFRAEAAEVIGAHIYRRAVKHVTREAAVWGSRAAGSSVG